MCSVCPAGGRQNVLELMDWWELVPDVDHNRCIIKHPLWFSLRILSIVGNKGNICLIFLSFTGCYIFWTDFLNWGPYFCGILRSTSSNVLHSKILACLIPFHLLNGFIVSYIPAHLSFGSEQSHACWIKLEPPPLIVISRLWSCPATRVTTWWALLSCCPACGSHGGNSLWHSSCWLVKALYESHMKNNTFWSSGSIMVPVLLPRRAP